MDTRGTSRRRAGRERRRKASSPSGEARSVREILRDTAGKVLPHVRRLGKHLASDLTTPLDGDEDPLLDPKYASIAEGLVDLACNVGEELLVVDPKAAVAPMGNDQPDLSHLSMSQLLGEIADRTGRQVILMPSTSGGESKTETTPPS